MKVCDLVEAYIAYRRSLGEKYQSPAVILRSFARYIGEDKECMSIDEKICTAFCIVQTIPFPPVGSCVTLH